MSRVGDRFTLLARAGEQQSCSHGETPGLRRRRRPRVDGCHASEVMVNERKLEPANQVVAPNAMTASTMAAIPLTDDAMTSPNTCALMAVPQCWMLSTRA